MAIFHICDLMRPILDVASRIPSPNLIWRNIFCNDSSCSNDSPPPNCNRIAYNCIHSDKDIVFDSNISYAKMYAGLISIQIMGKNFHTGGDSDIVSYRNILRSDSIYFDITIDKNPGGGLRKFHPGPFQKNPPVVPSHRQTRKCQTDIPEQSFKRKISEHRMNLFHIRFPNEF